MSTFNQVFCPVCFMAHGDRAERHSTKHYIKLGRHNFWEDAVQQHVEQYGVTVQSEGRGTLLKLGYFTPGEDPTGSYALVKACLLKATREWLDKGWLTVEEVEAMLQGNINVPAAVPRTRIPVPSPASRPPAPKIVNLKPVMQPKTRTKKRPATTPISPPESERTASEDLPAEKKVNLDALIEDLTNLMDEDDKAGSLKKLKKALAGIDEDKVDISEVESAIEEYEGITRSGMSPEDYQEGKQSAFEFIQQTIDEITLTDEGE